MITTRSEAFIAPARERPGLWRLFFGFALALLVLVIWVVVLFGALFLAAGLDGGPEWLNRMTQANTPTSALLVIAMLWGLGFGAMVAARALHARSGWTLYGPFRRMRRDFVKAAVVCFAIIGASLVIPFDYTPRAHLDLGLWLSFLPLALLVVLGQTLAEELFFRGYLQQQLMARTNSLFVGLVLPSILFGLAHYDGSAEPRITWLIVAATGVFGLCAADLTHRSGTIGAAWGFHFANNVVAILILSLDGSITGLALYLTPFDTSATDILAPLLMRDMGVTLAIWLALRWALAR